MAKIKLTACETTVASAAPNTSMPKPATSTRSRIRFIMAAMAININGLRLSPMPRRMALTML